MGYAVQPEDLRAGKNRVVVSGRGEGRALALVPSGRDPIGAVKVLHDNGATCSYENSDTLLEVLGSDLSAITPWTLVPANEEVWATEHVGGGGLAGRVYTTGDWNAYNGRGDYEVGRAADLTTAKEEVKRILISYGCDTSVLESD